VKFRINVDGRDYEVEVEVEAEEQDRPFLGVGGYMPMPSAARMPAQAAAPVAAPGAGAPVENEDKVCRSPIAGVVVRVNAKAGQQIQVGDPLVVLEAMKMETNITAPVVAKIAKVNIGVGDSVQTGQVLVEFE
jgi:methylmalonyl-CoA carboxyltransferase small subunit